MTRTARTITTLALALGLAARAGLAQSADPHAGHAPTPAPTASAARELAPVPVNLPGWMSNKKKNHLFYKRGNYNFDVYNLPALARDLNAVAVGHAMAY